MILNHYFQPTWLLVYSLAYYLLHFHYGKLSRFIAHTEFSIFFATQGRLNIPNTAYIWGIVENKTRVIFKNDTSDLKNYLETNHNPSIQIMPKSLIDQWSSEIVKEKIQHQCAVIIPIPTSHIAVVETSGDLAVIGSSSRIDFPVAIQIAINQRHIICLFRD
jgi:hypothetical protein